MKNKDVKLLFIFFLSLLVLPVLTKANLLTDINTYYIMNDSSGNLTESVRGYNTNSSAGAASYQQPIGYGVGVRFSGTQVFRIQSEIFATRTNGFSVCFLANTTTGGTTDNRILGTDTYSGAGGYSGMFFTQVLSTGKVSFIVRNSTTAQCEAAETAGTGTLNSPHTFCGVRNSTHIMLYRDGILNATTACSGSIDLRYSNTLKLGCIDAQCPDGNKLRGVLAQVGFWNYTFTSTEVQEYHNNITNNLTYPFTTSTPSAFVFWSFVNQSPSDLTTATFGSLNITYNTTQTMNTSSVYLNFTITNSTTSINGTATSQYLQQSATNTSTYWSSVMGDNQYFGGVYNYNESIVESTQRSGYVSLTTSNDLALISLINVRNDTLYNIFEVMMNTSSDGTANIFYCNSSYSTGVLTSSPNCIQIGTYSGTGFNHTHNPAYNYSRHNVFSFPVQNGFTGSVRVSNTSYFVIKRISGTIYVHYANLTSPRTNAFQTSNSNGASWTNLASTFLIDSHLHQYTGFNYFTYQMCGQNTTGSINCTDFRGDLIELSSLLPTSPEVYSPSSQDYNYTSNILFNFSPALPYIPSVYIKNYSFQLLNNDLSLNTTLSSFNFADLIYDGTAKSRTNAAYGAVTTYTTNQSIIKNVTATLESENNGYAGYLLLQFSYTDGTATNTSEQTSPTDSTAIVLHYTNPNPLKLVSNITTYIKGDTGGQVNIDELYIRGAGGNVTYYLNWTPSEITKSGNYYLKVIATDTNNLEDYGISEVFNITSIINIRVQDNFTSEYVGNFSGWIYNNATGWNQTFSTGTGILSTLKVYSGLNIMYAEQVNYSLTEANYFNFTLSDTLQTYNKTFQFYASNSVHIELYDQLTDLLINSNTSTIYVTSDTYNNQSNTTNGEVLFQDLPVDNYTILVTSPNYISASYEISVYNRSSQYIKARLLASVYNVSIGIYVKNQLYQPVENAVITIQRQFSGGSWATITQLSTDVNGFVYASLQESILYRFIVSAPNYNAKQFDMYVYEAIQPYTFVLTTTATTLYTNYWAGVNYYYAPVNNILNQSIYNFSITTYNSSLDIQWTSVTANGTTINVTGSPAGATANITLDLTHYAGALPVLYQFYFYNANTSTYSLYSIPKIYYVGAYNTTQDSLPEVWTDFKTEVDSDVWTTIIAMFLILAIIITLIQLSGSQVVGLIGGVAGLIFFGVVGMLSPVFAYLTGTIIAILLFMNRG